jgi:predicted nucleic acid-binding protein
MKYVLDSSVGFKWVVVEALTDKARLLRDDYCNAVHELLSPDVLAIEIAHALTKAERQGRISSNQGGILWKDVMQTAPILTPRIPLIPRAHEIAAKFRIGIYDCVYVALAELENCELVTADDRLVNNLKSTFPFIIHLATMP